MTLASVTDSLATSTVRFVEDHFEIHVEEWSELHVGDHTQDEKEKELENSDGAEAVFRSVLVEKRDLFVFQLLWIINCGICENSLCSIVRN